MTFFALMMCIVLSRAFMLTVYSAGYVAIDETNFPDKVFRDYVSEKFDTDGYLDTSEGAAVKKIDICNKGVSSLKGIEHFPEITELSCYSNNLTSLDVRYNTALVKLECFRNQITALDVRKNEDLLDLYCSNNYLTVLDISKNSLYGLDCHNNNLSFLCITSSPHLSCYKNNITLLDLSPSSNLCDVYINGDRYDDEYGDDVYTYWDPEALEKESLAIDKTTEVTTEPIPDTTISTQPKSVSAAIGTTAKFTVAATGGGLKYQWQVSTDGSTWKNSSATGYNTKTISLKATASKNGYRYRCVITDANGSKMTSTAAKLTVK